MDLPRTPLSPHAEPQTAGGAGTRDRIRDAALALFLRDGFRATSVRQIATAAATTHTTLYKYFKSKEAIALSLLEEIAPTIRAFHARVPGIIKDRAGFDQWFDDYSAFWLQHYPIYHAFWEAALANRHLSDWVMERSRIVLSDTWAQSDPALILTDGQREKLLLWAMSLDNLLSLVRMTDAEGQNEIIRVNLREMLSASFDRIFQTAA
ncbi:TetR/AcrR family transcriptional regulator [uncultured Novosphingobium sp.]|uniref:TetR/AcrR family transcriptional regulator n=1 Tax=Novosphingobium fluoreni TaxID=1391222 RepID=UPI003748491B